MEWLEENNRLKKTFKFKNFVEAFGFMTRVAIARRKNGSSSHVDEYLE